MHEESKPPWPDSVVRRLVKRWLKRLRLGRWKVHWDWTLAGVSDFGAQIRPWDNLEKCTLYLNQEDCAPFETLRHSVIHELLHLTRNGSDDVVFQLDELKVLPESTYQVLRQSYVRHMEVEIDNLACCLERVFDDDDLIPKPRKKRRTKR